MGVARQILNVPASPRLHMNIVQYLAIQRKPKNDIMTRTHHSTSRSMDVITIDSSDEEEAAADTDGKERIMVTSTLRRTLSTQSDDDNSSISSDDIWKTIGLSSRPKKDDSGADNDALLGNFKGRCIISPSEGGKGLQKATQFEHSSVHTVCNVLCVTAPSRKSKETPIIPPSDSDDTRIAYSHRSTTYMVPSTPPQYNLPP